MPLHIYMKRNILIAGDALAILITTFIGFATHDEIGISFLPRMAAAFFPLVVSWFPLAPFLGLFQPEIISKPKQLWRPVWAMIFAAPFAAVLRGLWLGSAIIPVFAIVLASTSAFGMLVWRGLYLFLDRTR